MAAGGKERIGGYVQCVLKDGSGPCGYMVFVGVVACIICIAFLVVDGLFDNLSNVKHRKYAVLADMGISATWVFMWFLAFCLVTSSWRKTVTKPPHGGGKISAVIAFSLFSIGSWIVLTVLAFLKFRQGSETAFGPSLEETSSQAPVNPYPGNQPPMDTFHQPPFMQQDSEPEKTSQYDPPVY